MSSLAARTSGSQASVSPRAVASSFFSSPLDFGLGSGPCGKLQPQQVAPVPWSWIPDELWPQQTSWNKREQPTRTSFMWNKLISSRTNTYKLPVLCTTLFVACSRSRTATRINTARKMSYRCGLCAQLDVSELNIDTDRHTRIPSHMFPLRKNVEFDCYYMGKL